MGAAVVARSDGGIVLRYPHPCPSPQGGRAIAYGIRKVSPRAVPPPLTPPHKGEGDPGRLPACRLRTAMAAEAPAPRSPSPLWGGVRGGGTAARPRLWIPVCNRPAQGGGEPCAALALSSPSGRPGDSLPFEAEAEPFRDPPPLCGEGSGVGVRQTEHVSGFRHAIALPSRGRGAGARPLRNFACTHPAPANGVRR